MSGKTEGHDAIARGEGGRVEDVSEDFGGGRVAVDEEERRGIILEGGVVDGEEAVRRRYREGGHGWR